jgi:hypothetical protein
MLNRIFATKTKRPHPQSLPKYPNPAKNVGQASGDIWGGRIEDRQVTSIAS